MIGDPEQIMPVASLAKLFQFYIKCRLERRINNGLPLTPRLGVGAHGPSMSTQHISLSLPTYGLRLGLACARTSPAYLRVGEGRGPSTCCCYPG